MRTWLKYVLFGGHLMGFVPQTIEFGVKFKFLLKIYAITWKDGWNMSYLVVTRCVLASPRVLTKSRIEVKVGNDLNMCFYD
jgi:hypothetical protein